MANYEVTEIVSTEPKAYQGLDKTYFMTGGSQVYMFHKSENTPKAGDILDGTITYDRGQNMKFTRTKNNAFAPAPVPAVTPAGQVSLQEFADSKPPLPKPTDKVPAMPERTFKADPDKMKQTFSLEVAKNMSIMRQVAVKAAVDLIVAGKQEDLVRTYTDVMQLLSEPEWQKFAAPMDDRFENELPPVESYDNLPTDEQVDDYDNDLDRAMAEAIAKDK